MWLLVSLYFRRRMVGKREEAWPCGTYVCCEAKDGLEWESWENKLGVLAGGDMCWV